MGNKDKSNGSVFASIIKTIYNTEPDKDNDSNDKISILLFNNRKDLDLYSRDFLHQFYLYLMQQYTFIFMRH